MGKYNIYNENNENLCSMGFIIKKEVDVWEAGRGLVRTEPGLARRSLWSRARFYDCRFKQPQKMACLRVSWGGSSRARGPVQARQVHAHTIVPVLWADTHSLAAHLAQGWRDYTVREVGGNSYGACIMFIRKHTPQTLKCVLNLYGLFLSLFPKQYNCSHNVYIVLDVTG